MKNLYYNGDILTMEDYSCEAIYVEDGIIKKCGNYQEILADLDEDIVKIDLKGKCLMPAFIDSHSHLVSLASTLSLIDLTNCKSIAEIILAFKQFIATNKPKDTTFLIGFGYDHNFLKEKRHPLAKDLDQISATQPIMISHASGHMGVINTKALELFGLCKETKDFEGGKYGRNEDGSLNGYLEEKAFIDLTTRVSGNNPDLSSQVLKALNIYASFGITTVQEGYMKDNEFNLLNQLAADNQLFLDVVGYVDIKEHRDIYLNNPKYHQYVNRFKLGGYKLFLDGSPQGKTAWLSKPYENSGDYCGYPIYQDAQVKEYVDFALTNKAQLLTHCNGDAAANQLLDAFNKPTSLRPVMIHSQTLRLDQLPRLKQIGMIPSFFINHIYHWGDIHLRNLGSRAQKISCANSALQLEIPFTFHQDSPVIKPNMLESVWCAVTRQTKNGAVLGQDEQISVYEALKAITINAAYQYFEEDSKGSIKVGKLADLVILDANPCQIKPEMIKDISIIQTIKEGIPVYTKEI